MKRTALPLFEGFIETPFEQRFQGLLRQAWKLRRWHVIVAEPGSGKTMGIRDVSAQASREAGMMGGRHYPVLAVTAPKNDPKEAALGNFLLTALGLGARGRWSERKYLLFELLVQYGVEWCAASVQMELLSKTRKVEGIMTFRATTYPKAKADGGQQHVDESGNRPKGGRSGLRKLSAHGETGTVKPEFPRDGCHIRHPLPKVTMLKYHVRHSNMKTRQHKFVDANALFSMRQEMILRGNRRAPKRSKHSICAKAGSPTGRKTYGDGTLIVPDQRAQTLPDQGRSNPRSRVRVCP